MTIKREIGTNPPTGSTFECINYSTGPLSEAMRTGEVGVPVMPKNGLAAECGKAIVSRRSLVTLDPTHASWLQSTADLARLWGDDHPPVVFAPQQ